MAERIYDPSVLQEPADFTMRIDVDKEYPIPNADGTPATVACKVTAPTIAVALQILSMVNPVTDEEQILSDACIAEILGKEDQEQLEKEDEEVIFKLISDEMEATGEWRTVRLEFDLEQHDEKNEAIVELTGPSYGIIIRAFANLSSEQRLNAFIGHLMPLADEEDGDY